MKRLFSACVLVFVLIASACSPAKNPNDRATDMIQAFQKASIPIANVTALTAENDPNELLGRPNQYVAKVDWKDTRVKADGAPGIDTGGTLEVFSSEKDMNTRWDYLKSVTANSLFAEYSFGKGTILLRLSNALTPAQAKEYQDLFEKQK